MDLNWNTAIQAVILALTTAYIRHGSKKDTQSAAQKVQNSTAAQSTSDEILKRVSQLEVDVAHIREIQVTQFGIDHRGPGRNN